MISNDGGEGYIVIEKIYNNSRVGNSSALIRHSIREEIIDARFSKDVPLTEEGRNLSIEFGKQLPVDRYLRLFHSHSPRCKETAELILNGYESRGGSGNVEGARSFLGSPFMLKPEIALGCVNDLGGPGFIREWFKSNIEQTIVEPPGQAINKLVTSIKKLRDTGVSNEIHFMITHDFTIILLLGLLFDLAEQEFIWPGYLKGVVIRFEDERIELSYEGLEKSYKISDFMGEEYVF